jgi:methylmalonyl-CoA/ethylmalonyl-CoA epimerase
MGTNSTGPGIQGIGQIAIMVEDIERAIEFYRDVLGLKLWMQVPNMAFFHCGDVRLMLGLAETPDLRGKTSILYFRVPDTDAAEAHLRAAGAEIAGPSHLVARLPDHELWMAFFRDSERNLMAVMAQKPLAA